MKKILGRRKAGGKESPNFDLVITFIESCGSLNVNEQVK